MKRLLRRFALIAYLSLCWAASGQSPNYPQNTNNLFSGNIRSSLSGTASVLTIEHPTGNNENDKIVSAYLYCSVACTVSLERGGTVPTATAGTVNSMNTKITGATTNVTVWTGSTSTGGVVENTYDLNASFISLDASLFQFSANTEDNVTLRSSSVTGVVALQLVWQKI